MFPQAEVAELEGAVAEQEREVQLQTKEAEEEMVGGEDGGDLSWRSLHYHDIFYFVVQNQSG